MASNLTNQVREIADVTTAIANGDLSRKVLVHAKGEILELQRTINTMVNQLRGFTVELSRVSREVAVEGILGGQAEIGEVASAVLSSPTLLLWHVDSYFMVLAQGHMEGTY